MEKEFLNTLTVNELKQNIGRLHTGVYQLIELLTTLDEEKQELLSTKDMLLKTLTGLLPKKYATVNSIKKIAEIMKTDKWDKQIKSEDSEEWNKIIQEFK